MKIAYLAPEIPALSATFVYNEILTLLELGYQVLPISVLKPLHEADDTQLAELKRQVVQLYATPKLSVLASHALLLCKHPFRYLSSLGWLMRDLRAVGVGTRTSFGLVYRFFFAGHLARLIECNQVQHLHVHFAHVPTDIAMYAAHIVGIGFSVTAHANDIFERGWLLPEKVARSAFFATISEFNKRYLIEKKQVKPEKVTVVRCGVETRHLTPKPFGYLSFPLKIGVLGRLVEKKGIDTLIDALALLVEQGVAVDLKIAGAGPLQDSLMQKVEALQLGDRVAFLGALPHSEMPQFLTSLDLFVLPCKKDSHGDMDGIPVVLMEAMRLGVPVISSAISGIPELVIDHVTGLLTQPDDAAELARAILKLCGDRELQEKITRNAAMKVEQEFSLQANVQRLDKLFKSIV